MLASPRLSWAIGTMLVTTQKALTPSTVVLPGYEMTDEATRLLREIVDCCDAGPPRPYEPGYRWYDAIETARAYLSRPTEQAIVPPREPTQAMLHAARKLMLGVLVKEDAPRLEAVWTAMYDAAIAEGKQP